KPNWSFCIHTARPHNLPGQTMPHNTTTRTALQLLFSFFQLYIFSFLNSNRYPALTVTLTSLTFLLRKFFVVVIPAAANCAPCELLIIPGSICRRLLSADC